jgi:hypothetical protein
MAQRLEAALRKPASEARAPANQVRPPAATEQAARSDSPQPSRSPRGSEQRPPDTNKPNQNKTAIYDTLEQEMANLLGRPPKS